MKITPLRIAVAIVLFVLAVCVCFVRPPQLSVQHAQPAMHTSEPSAVPVPLHARPRPLLVYVAGAVVHPGVYGVAADARAGDALAKAGGASADADLVAVNLAAHVADGDEIAVPHRGESRPAVAHSGARDAPRNGRAHGTHRHRRSHRTPRDTATGASFAPKLVNINAAQEDELAELPGIGPALAERIVEFRALNGPFVSVDGLGDVAGITPLRLDELEPLVTVGR